MANIGDFEKRLRAEKQRAMQGFRIRHGEAWMDALYLIDADLWASIKGTPADCSQLDERIPAFLREILNKDY